MQAHPGGVCDGERGREAPIGLLLIKVVGKTSTSTYENRSKHLADSLRNSRRMMHIPLSHLSNIS